MPRLANPRTDIPTPGSGTLPLVGAVTVASEKHHALTHTFAEGTASEASVRLEGYDRPAHVQSEGSVHEKLNLFVPMYVDLLGHLE